MKNKLQRLIYDGDNNLNITNIRYLPRWLVIAIDSFILIVSILISHSILLNLDFKSYRIFTTFENLALIFFVNLYFFFAFKTYAGLIRHSTFADVTKIFLSCFSTALALTAINYIYIAFTGNRLFLIPGLMIYFAISFSLLLSFRLIVKRAYRFLKHLKTAGFKKRVVIYGTDDNAVSVAEALRTDSVRPFELVGFLSDRMSYKKIRILNKPVIGYGDKVYEKFDEYGVEGIIIIGNTLSVSIKNKLVDDCMSKNIQMYNLPGIEEWSDKKDLSQQIKTVQIEDLLNRKAIAIDDDLIRKDLKDKTVLVTGGAGSIGSEICRQVASYRPACLVVLDQAETPLHEIELELRKSFPKMNLETVLASITNPYRLDMVFGQHRFDVIYHAAAYKHVPLVEQNAHEAVFVNVAGTINLVERAIAQEVSKFVMVSSDKAVNPTNVMGASKRAAERYVQSIQQHPGVKTRFITTRFGNVLGSNGSVIPHFKKQIAAGGPVTVTHPDIIRYFMTVSEACQLVLQAGTMGEGGEVYVFDMGRPVKILDLAKRMIRLSGFVPDEDIAIKFTGLRAGEKLYEELLCDTSVNLPTHHEKIMIAKDEPMPFREIRPDFDILVSAARQSNDTEVVRWLKIVVDNYKSVNSKFEALDLGLKDVEK